MSLEFNFIAIEVLNNCNIRDHHNQFKYIKKCGWKRHFQKKNQYGNILQHLIVPKMINVKYISTGKGAIS